MGRPVYLVEFTAKVSPRYFCSGAPAAWGSIYTNAGRIPVSGAVTYLLTAQARRDASADGKLYVGIYYYDSAGARIAGNYFYAANNLTPGTSWATYSATFGAATGNAIPGGAVTMEAFFAINYASTAGRHHIKACFIANNAAPTVALTTDPRTRSLAFWTPVVHANTTAATVLTELDGPAENLTLRYSTGAYITGPGDSPPSTPYEARVRQPGFLRMALPTDFSGGITASYGEIVLANEDGALGDLAYYGLAGQEFCILMGADDMARSAFAEVLRGTMQVAVVDRKKVTIRLAGLDARLSNPLLTDRYDGTGTLGGTAATIGLHKPRIFGVVTGVEPVCVNESLNIYQVSTDRVVMQSLNIAGVMLTRGAAYADQTDMETNAPAAGQWRSWEPGGCFRLGTAAQGVIRMDAYKWYSGFVVRNNPWEVLYEVAAAAGVPTGEFQYAIGDYNSQVNPDNWGSAQPIWNYNECGVYVTDGRSARDLMNQVVEFTAAWWGYIHWGGTPGSAMKLGWEMFPPKSSALSVATSPVFDASNITEVRGLPDPSPGAGVPTWKVSVAYAHNYTVLRPEMAPAVPSATLGTWAVEDYWSEASDPAILDKHPTAGVMVRQSLLASASASLHAERLLELMRYPKAWYGVRVPLSAVLSQAYKPRLGGYVYCSWPELRVLSQDGATRNSGWFSVMAIDVDFAMGQVHMTLRQATEQSI